LEAAFVIISRTPFRISFFGGGTDYPEYFEKYGPGAVLATAIDKSIFISASRFNPELFDYKLRIAYSKVELVKELEEMEHTPFREILKFHGLRSGLEFSLHADLPSFSGTGSSSSFVVGLLRTIWGLLGIVGGNHRLAECAIDVERTTLRESVGYQDQITASHGGLNVVRFGGHEQFSIHPLNLSDDLIRNFESHLLFVYTGVRRRASDIAAKQIDKIGDNLSTLRELYECVDVGAAALRGGEFYQFGTLMHQTWIRKKTLDDGISSGKIDEFYETAIRHGAWGGKLLGAGGGGFLLFIVPPEKRASVVAALPGCPEVPIRINAKGSEIIYRA
jgi:D-glycero-alpha-D-manno-heptose-7-phosphate kinase